MCAGPVCVLCPCVWAICTSHTHTHKRYCLMCHQLAATCQRKSRSTTTSTAHFSIQSVVLCELVSVHLALLPHGALARLRAHVQASPPHSIGAALCFREMSLHANSRKYYKPLSIDVCVRANRRGTFPHAHHRRQSVRHILEINHNHQYGRLCFSAPKRAFLTEQFACMTFSFIPTMDNCSGSTDSDHIFTFSPRDARGLDSPGQQQMRPGLKRSGRIIC